MTRYEVEPGPGIMLPQTMWASDVSAELYNQNNPEKSAQLLQEAGYDGTPIRLLCTEEDLVRLHDPSALPGLLALRSEAQPHEPERLTALLREALRAPR